MAIGSTRVKQEDQIEKEDGYASIGEAGRLRPLSRCAPYMLLAGI
jgi:hypothetical protein